MNKIHQAIKLAIENGYGHSFWRTRLQRDPDTEWTSQEWEEVFDFDVINKCLLDPLFWQALGKALGWSDVMAIIESDVMAMIENENILSKLLAHAIKESREKIGYYPMWVYRWHKFIDNLVEGKDIESFFEELLKK